MQENVVASPTQDTNKKLLTCQLEEENAKAENVVVFPLVKRRCKVQPPERTGEGIEEDEDDDDIITLSHQITDLLMGEKPIDQQNFRSVVGTRTYENNNLDKYRHVEVTYIHRDPMMGHG